MNRQVNTYLRDTAAEKAFKEGKSLLLLGHIKNVMTHSISSNIRFCFVKGYPEQKLGQNPYTVCISLHKDSGAVVNGECTCVTGYVKFLFSKFIMRIALIVVIINNKNVKY